MWAAALLVLGCRVEAGGAEGSRQAEAADQIPAEGYARMTGPRERCEAEARPLEPARSIPLEEPVDRLLVRGGELFAVTEGGLRRLDGAAWEPVLDGGRDYAFYGDTVLRLAGDSVEFHRYRPGARPTRVRALPARPHEASIAVAGGSLVLHSAVSRDNLLVRRRRTGDGALVERLVPVERDFLGLFFDDFERLLEDTGRVRAAGRWFAFVPLLQGPVRLYDVRGRRRWDLPALARERGRLEVVNRRVVRDTRACARCGGEVKEILERRLHRIHADAFFAAGAVWVLGSGTPGGRRPVVARFEPLRPTWLRVHRLAALDSSPRAMALFGGRLLVASERRLYWFERPEEDPSRGGSCAS